MEVNNALLLQAVSFANNLSPFIRIFFPENTPTFTWLRPGNYAFDSRRRQGFCTRCHVHTGSVMTGPLT